MVHVLFLCLGNICRSPMAEAIFRDHVHTAGLRAAITTDSAGTAGWHEGKLPHEGTRAILEEHGISYEGIRARQVMIEDGEKFDYIVVMDDQNKQDVQQILPKDRQSKIVKLTDF